MLIKVIKTEEAYTAALERINELFDAKPGTHAFDEVELLMLLVDVYEREHYPIDAPDPIEAIKFRMEQLDLKRSDLTQYFGTRARVSEILNKQRKLTVGMMRKLHKEFGIPAESLLG